MAVLMLFRWSLNCLTVFPLCVVCIWRWCKLINKSLPLHAIHTCTRTHDQRYLRYHSRRHHITLCHTQIYYIYKTQTQRSMPHRQCDKFSQNATSLNHSSISVNDKFHTCCSIATTPPTRRILYDSTSSCRYCYVWLLLLSHLQCQSNTLTCSTWKYTNKILKRDCWSTTHKRQKSFLPKFEGHMMPNEGEYQKTVWLKFRYCLGVS